MNMSTYTDASTKNGTVVIEPSITTRDGVVIIDGIDTVVMQPVGEPVRTRDGVGC